MSEYVYHLKGFDRKLITLAEHLAKLLEHDVAGYQPSGPNPNRYPDRGWCKTVQRIVEQLDKANYTPNQLGRDLNKVGFTVNQWQAIMDALVEVIQLRLCDDYWGTFKGGSLIRLE